jgi:hypothetical protein
VLNDSMAPGLKCNSILRELDCLCQKSASGNIHVPTALLTRRCNRSRNRACGGFATVPQGP